MGVDWSGRPEFSGSDMSDWMHGRAGRQCPPPDTCRPAARVEIKPSTPHPNKMNDPLPQTRHAENAFPPHKLAPKGFAYSQCANKPFDTPSVLRHLIRFHWSLVKRQEVTFAIFLDFGVSWREG